MRYFTNTREKERSIGHTRAKTRPYFCLQQWEIKSSRDQKLSFLWVTSLSSNRIPRGSVVKLLQHTVQLFHFRGIKNYCFIQLAGFSRRHIRRLLAAAQRKPTTQCSGITQQCSLFDRRLLLGLKGLCGKGFFVCHQFIYLFIFHSIIALFMYNFKSNSNISAGSCPFKLLNFGVD